MYPQNLITEHLMIPKIWPCMVVSPLWTSIQVVKLSIINANFMERCFPLKPHICLDIFGDFWAMGQIHRHPRCKNQESTASQVENIWQNQLCGSVPGDTRGTSKPLWMHAPSWSRRNSCSKCYQDADHDTMEARMLSNRNGRIMRNQDMIQGQNEVYLDELYMINSMNITATSL